MNDDHLVYFECLPLFVGETLDMLVPSSVRVWIFLEVASSIELETKVSDYFTIAEKAHITSY